MTITNNDSLSERMMLFRDKGWTRKPGWGARTYAFLAPNYRMTELQGAVGVVQTEKVRSVVTKRNELGDLLSSLIRGLPGVQPAPVTSGGRHTYWIYPLRVTEGSAEVFARALCAEGIPAEAHYIGEPIFLCMEALANKVTFGSSQHPLDGCHGGRQLEYTHGICPQTEQALRELVTLSIHEGMSREDVEDIAAAIRKVAYGLTEKALG